MQLELVLRFYGFKDDDKILEWITKHSFDFGKLADSREGGIDLIALYKTDSERALALAEERLYQEEGKERKDRRGTQS